MRINVVGTAGSGKSTISKRIAQKLDVPYVQLDEIFWKPNWKESCDEEFFSKVEEIVSSDGWILDGNYTRTIPLLNGSERKWWCTWTCPFTLFFTELLREAC